MDYLYLYILEHNASLGKVMSYHTCDLCGNEARFVCVKCKRDISKTHAHYERS